jgi:hypothetical protein
LHNAYNKRIFGIGGMSEDDDFEDEFEDDDDDDESADDDGDE